MGKGEKVNIMARERMVTRTVVLTKCEALCIDVTTAETSINLYHLTGNYSTTDSALKALKKDYETDTFKVVAIQDIAENEILYGMSELDFIEHAKVLDPETRKPIE